MSISTILRCYLLPMYIIVYKYTLIILVLLQAGQKCSYKYGKYLMRTCTRIVFLPQFTIINEKNKSSLACGNFLVV